MADDETHMKTEQTAASAKRAAGLRNGVNVAFRQILALTGLIMIVVPIAILGVVLLGRNAMWGRRWMESVLARHPRVERFAPNWLMRLVFGRDKKDPSQPEQ